MSASQPLTEVQLPIKPGHRIGGLLVVNKAPLDVTSWGGRVRRRILWNCLCDCGKKATVPEANFRRPGRPTTSCGCARNKPSPSRSNPDPLARSRRPEYNVWVSMKGRCFNPNTNGYRHYGARGIVVCPRWADSFDAFYEDMGPRPSPSHQIDRIDNDGNYAPENCRWATRAEQSRNRRTNRYVRLDGERMLLKDACEKLGISSSTFSHRLKFGYSEEEALAPPWK